MQVAPLRLSLLWLRSCIVVLVAAGMLGSLSHAAPHGASLAPPRAAPHTTPDADERPNIILIMADDLDARLGTIDYMPALKRLMIDQGTTIEDFFVTQPICCPS